MGIFYREKEFLAGKKSGKMTLSPQKTIYFTPLSTTVDFFLIQRFVKATNIEFANAMLECTIEDGNDSLKPEDILGTEYFTESLQWLVYMNTKEAKVNALSEDSITIKEKTFKLEDYAIKASVKRTNKLFRLSIHDLPQSVSKDYIAEWVDSFAKRESDVMKHIVKPKESIYIAAIDYVMYQQYMNKYQDFLQSKSRTPKIIKLINTEVTL